MYDKDVGVVSRFEAVRQHRDRRGSVGESGGDRSGRGQWVGASALGGVTSTRPS